MRLKYAVIFFLLLGCSQKGSLRQQIFYEEGYTPYEFESSYVEGYKISSVDIDRLEAALAVRTQNPQVFISDITELSNIRGKIIWGPESETIDFLAIVISLDSRDTGAAAVALNFFINGTGSVLEAKCNHSEYFDCGLISELLDQSRIFTIGYGV